MEEAYTIGITLALENGMSEGLAVIRRDLGALDVAAGATSVGLSRLVAQAGAALAATRGASVAPVAGGVRPAPVRSVGHEAELATRRASGAEKGPEPESMRAVPPPVPAPVPVREVVRPAAMAPVVPEPVRTAVVKPPSPEVGREERTEPAVRAGLPVPRVVVTPAPRGDAAGVAPPAPLAARRETRPDVERDPARVEERPTAMRDGARVVAVAPPFVVPAREVVQAPRGSVPAMVPLPERVPEPRRAVAVPERIPQAVSVAVAEGSGKGRTVAPATPVLPRTSGAAAVRRAAPEPWRNASVAPAARERPESAAPGDVYLDGELVGHWIAGHMARQAARPPSGGTGFDLRMTPVWGDGAL